MERVLFSILETSIIMSGAILLLMLFSKLFAGKTRPAKRHLCWLIVAVGLLVTYRPTLLTIPLPQPQANHGAEALLFADSSLILDWAGMEHSFEGGTYLNPDLPVITDPAVSDCNILMPGLEPGGILDTEYNPAITLENPTTLDNPAALENPEEIILISVTETEEMAAVTIYPAELTILRDILLPSLLAVWALGALGIILFYALRHIRFIRRVKKNSHEITFGPLHNLLIRIRCHAGIKRKVRLMTGPFITVPMMYGFFRPVIILPAYVLNANEEQQRLIILHEALHIKRGDIIARLLFLVAVAVHWFNPLVHLMNRLALDESERACDDAVLRYSGAETRKQYSRTLLQVARQDMEAHDALTYDALIHEALAHALTSGGKNIKNRLKNILSQQKPGRLALLICTALMVVGVGIFSVIHFGGASEDEPDYNYIQDGQRPDEEIHNILLQAPGEVLNIFTPMGSANIHVTAVADELRSQGIAVNITAYLPEEREDIIARKLSLFAGGMGPDIFIVESTVDSLLYRFIENDFLMDINELIPDRPLFYENALAGFEVGGSLYALPISFSFNMVGINNALPPEIINRFATLETASVSQLMEIYAELITGYPQFSDFYFTNLLWPTSIIDVELAHALDFHNGTAAFPDSTAQLLYDLRTYVQGNHNPIYIQGSADVEMAEALHENTVFHIPRAGNVAANAFFPFEREFFTHYVPMTDERGILADRSAPFAVAVGANADEALAWAFIEAFLAETGANHISTGGLSIHISRLHSIDYLERGIRSDLARFPSRPITTGVQDAVTDAATDSMAFAERLIVRPVSRFLMPFDLVYPTLMYFLEGGNITAAGTIREMEREILYWMGQVIQIAAYEPAPLIEDPADAPPVRTLTVRVDNRHTALFRQAEAAMNETWQERGEEYTFQLIVDDWSVNDHAGAGRRAVRLQTELMAGQGPDIFLVDSMFNMRAFARNGFLADIYTLMDACGHTSRNDFFENVLEAFEFDGRLYMFPTSFGFFQVGINPDIPQRYITEHTARDTVTLQNMFETYISVRSHIDYAHMQGGIRVGSMQFNAVQAAMIPFIDFGTRTANLTDPRFIAQLELIYNVFDGRFHIHPGISGRLPNSGYFNAISNHVYEMSYSRMLPAGPFFPRTTYYFTEYRPLADEAGHLIINPFNETLTWALLSVTAAGQPELAWEFIMHLLHEYPRAEGHAAICPVFGEPANWAGLSIGTPILRENADMPRRMFESVTDPQAYGQHIDWNFYSPREVYIDAAMERLAEMNEMPVVLNIPLIPIEAWSGTNHINMNNFMAGAITAEAFAQMMQNSVSLWLIE